MTDRESFEPNDINGHKVRDDGPDICKPCGNAIHDGEPVYDYLGKFIQCRRCANSAEIRRVDD